MNVPGSSVYRIREIRHCFLDVFDVTRSWISAPRIFATLHLTIRSVCCSLVYRYCPSFRMNTFMYILIVNKKKTKEKNSYRQQSQLCWSASFAHNETSRAYVRPTWNRWTSSVSFQFAQLVQSYCYAELAVSSPAGFTECGRRAEYSELTGCMKGGPKTGLFLKVYNAYIWWRRKVIYTIHIKMFGTLPGAYSR